MGSTSADSAWVDPDELRTSFTLAMSTMYRSEVPLYGDLVRIVAQINCSEISSALDPKVLAMRFGDVEPSRLELERHGAIRLGTAQELRTIRRLFALIGLYPVGYYDLSKAGLPMHATCFRPVTGASLRRNPFRVFTSVLRPELLKNGKARDVATRLLSKRNIFSDRLLQLLDLGDEQGGRLMVPQGRELVQEAIKTFGWRETSAASREDYEQLKAEHPILADVACFQSAHINHLTPRTLDITTAQEEMQKNGLRVKDRIEGPPPRKCPILLRQTSFLAIEESIKFLGEEDDEAGPQTKGTHKARFGEIEERGAAVTKAGRELYDQLFDEIVASESQRRERLGQDEYYDLVSRVFKQYPDDWRELRRRGLLYYTLEPTSKAQHARPTGSSTTLETLLDDGVVEAFPITYEDFLPLSAAGIFQSNLDSEAMPYATATSDPEGLEKALGVPINDPDALYQRLQDESVARCSAFLGLEIR
ncbi:hypothetical protein CMUS01_16013 [Colletotrichum musicola]|uniref:2-oxoadipate dioxygenase/decarboxylase n=1 Tax=Colletotrichum musicola TaxID=2175873 RepID=A0A8H6IRN0_9PEZI|nr:hypothetical protein CMUS01_16013 [Colletotrichum musicola]